MTLEQLRQRSRYRSELTIVLHILRIIKEKGCGIILTNMLTQAQLDHKRALNLLDKLITSGIITKEVGVVSHIQTKGRKIYKLTENGFIFLDELENFYTSIKKYNLEITI